ncbi:MAG TPA: hypothetical protein G4O03_00995 [Dehalococcoidia bacterium]|nr:hypothetical protein [Dehalococcoidia bacterium]
MEIADERIRYAIEHTEVLKLPKQTLATFGTTNVDYYLLTEPVYTELVNQQETVIRAGKVSSERPRIVTPTYLTKLEGFTENARRYIELLAREHPHAPGLLYSYKNEPKELTIVSDPLNVVASRLNEKIDREGEKLAAIIKGVDELWDVSLLKFISQLTEGSLGSNIAELRKRGLLDIDRAGIPREARLRIEELFELVKQGLADPAKLKIELDRWDLFEEYEDRFLSLFRRR